MTTALTTTNGAGMALAPADHSAHAFEPGNLSEALTLAGALHKGGLLPAHFKNPEAVVTAIIYGRELGLSAMQSIRGIHVIEGKPSMSADMMAALVKRSPVCEYFRLVESTATKATYTTKRRDEPEPTTMSYTIEQARIAGALGKKNWQAHPDAMLRARCTTGLARAVYPDLVMGVYDPEELEPAGTVTVVSSVPAAAVPVEVSTQPGEPTAEEVETDRKAAHTALIIRLQEIAKLGAKDSRAADLKAARDEYLKPFGVASSADLTKAQCVKLLRDLDEAEEAAHWASLVTKHRDARWTAEALRKEQAEAAGAEEEIPPFNPAAEGEVA